MVEIPRRLKIVLAMALGLLAEGSGSRFSAEVVHLVLVQAGQCSPEVVAGLTEGEIRREK